MTDKAIIEAATRAIIDAGYNPATAEDIARIVTPLIRAATLEEAALVAEDYVQQLETDAGEDIATEIRALKEQPVIKWYPAP